MSRKAQNIAGPIRKIVQDARVARLATFDTRGRPHIVPVCFVYDGTAFYSAIDQKPKRVSPERLVRLQNIRAVSRVALLIDHYDEDWSKLWYVLVRGRAELLPTSAQRERASAIRKLRAKYPQYTVNMLAKDAPIIRIIPKRVTFWGNV